MSGPARILLRMGVAALKPRRVGQNMTLGPILSRREAMKVRKEWLDQGRPWPYEELVPGIPKLDPYKGGQQKGVAKKAIAKEERERKIAEAMAKMPELIAEYRASRRIPWDSVTEVDKLLMTRKQIYDKYVRRKLK